MIEHRLIDRMLALLAHRASQRSKKPEILIMSFSTSNINFWENKGTELHMERNEVSCVRKQKSGFPEDLKMLNELIEEHGRTRKAVERLESARRQQSDKEISYNGNHKACWKL